MLLEVFKYIGIGLAIPYLFSSTRCQTNLLGSMSTCPHDIYTPDFYPNGSYLELPLGTMRYWLFGPEEGKRVVLVHGISTGSSVYDRLARDLANSGHRVLIFDTWGRGYTDAPATIYNEALYTSQLAMLLQKVGWTKCSVVGVSLGGATATSFTALYPEMVDRLVLIAPAGIMTKGDMPLTQKILRNPTIHQFVLNQAWLRPWLLSQIEKFSKSVRLDIPNLEEDIQESSHTIAKITSFQFKNHPGFVRAFIGTIVEYPLTGLVERYKKVGQDSDRPILVILGDKDKTVPFYPEEVKRLLPKAKLAMYEGHGHDVLNTRWRSVHEEIKDILNS